MSNPTDPTVPQIVYSCVSKRVIDGELFIRQHVIDYIISGSSMVYFGNKAQTYNAGDFRFAVKNRLSKFVKQPPDGGEYRSVSICIDQDTLLEMSAPYQRSIAASRPYDNVFLLQPNTLFRNYMDSLAPYLENSQQITGELLKTKIKEAVLIFLGANPDLKHLLFDFSEPGKIDLEAFMEEHYQYDGDLQHFAYLTGRSVSTFKRDFEKIYHTTPGKWLIQKKLEAAHLLLKQKKMKPTEVFLEVGFNDYSHFSTAFKKQFGAAPSMV
ncbi:helix-turn-helix transcriptional regulator [Chitinophaga agrisoli]|uniref:Helix-turn-helix transcriptional regulator n=1 Tax=Chitinophaga agrisoli TaxID=2607653 RepID=A0A5B2W155_9BACT|nr:AraC family transcriptional regulator [Chitinophaga agrisoli]KAA2245381.1 helix-turn-helix transcriptional regulator [Chitinophaga agrisoli]